MRLIAQVVSYVALVAVVVLAFLFYFDVMDLPQMKLWMLIDTIVWFVATPLWMGRAKPAAQQ
jgi:hypothetical protein